MAKSFKKFRKEWDDEWDDDDLRRKDKKMRDRRNKRLKKTHEKMSAFDDTDDE